MTKVLVLLSLNFCFLLIFSSNTFLNFILSSEILMMFFMFCFLNMNNPGEAGLLLFILVLSAMESVVSMCMLLKYIHTNKIDI